MKISIYIIYTIDNHISVLHMYICIYIYIHILIHTPCLPWFQHPRCVERIESWRWRCIRTSRKTRTRWSCHLGLGGWLGHWGWLADLKMAFFPNGCALWKNGNRWKKMFFFFSRIKCEGAPIFAGIQEEVIGYDIYAVMVTYRVCWGWSTIY